MEKYKRTFVWTGQIEVKITISLRHEYIGLRGLIGNCISSLRRQGLDSPLTKTKRSQNFIISPKQYKKLSSNFFNRVLF